MGEWRPEWEVLQGCEMPERIKIIRQGRASNRYGTGREGGHTGGGFLSPLDVRSSSHEGDASTAGTLATGKGRPPGGCGGQPPTLSSMLQQEELPLQGSTKCCHVFVLIWLRSACPEKNMHGAI